MQRQLTGRSIAAIAAAAALAACGHRPAEPIPDPVQAFVAGEPVPERHAVTVEFEDSATGVTLFAVSYGPPQDCPSGCFYAVAHGVLAEGRIGWWDPPRAAGPWRLFDIRPTDAPLFDADVLSRLKSERPSVYFSFGNFLACDPDTPAALREHLVAELGHQPFCGR
jgi:hypothetical protein